MKKLKIFILIASTLIFYDESSAQTIEVKGGTNLSTMLSKDRIETYSEDYQLTPRLLIGITADYPFTERFSLESGILFSSKGYKLEANYALYQNSEPFRVYQNAVLNYIEIPLLFKGSAKVRELSIFSTIGPYVGIGLSGEMTANSYSIGIAEKQVYSHEMGADGNWKRLDYGLQAGVGMEIRRIVIKISYSYGLANISQNKDLVVLKNRNLGLTLGYKFNMRKTSS